MNPKLETVPAHNLPLVGVCDIDNNFKRNVVLPDGAVFQKKKRNIKTHTEFLQLCTENERERIFQWTERLHQTGRDLESGKFWKDEYEKSIKPKEE